MGTTLMHRLRQASHYWLAVPFKWIFYYFFQPNRFKAEFEDTNFLHFQDLISILRLILPILLITFPFALLIRIILFKISDQPFAFIDGGFLLSAVLGTFLGVLSGGALGAIGGVTGIIPLGIVGGITTDIPFGIAGGLTGFAASSWLAFITLILEGFLIGSIFTLINQAIRGDTRGVFIKSVWMGLRTGLAVFLAVGLVTFISISQKGIEITATSDTLKIYIEDILSGVLLGLAFDLRSGIILGIILCTTRFFTGDIQLGINSGIFFLISYFVGYFRLLLFPVSAFSVWRAYRASRKKPQEVFIYLDRSALYWDERVYLELPGLEPILFIAIDQSIEEALREINFIISKRFQQRKAAWAAGLEIAIRDLETRDSLEELVQASNQLTKFISPEASLIDPLWVIQFARLSDVSRDAARYYRTTNKVDGRAALDDMVWNLKKISPNTTTEDTEYYQRLHRVVENWLAIARREQEKLDKVPSQAGEIENPYVVGPWLKQGSRLFVGRHDLIQQLENALNRGNDRPTFFLTGERRMGKTSTLAQLPKFLGARYIPIIYDLQSPGILTNIAAFLSYVGDGIYKAVIERGLHVRRLESKHLHEATRENEAAVYHIFDEWLHRIEIMLEEEDRTLLLAFDEFEKLEDVEQKHYFDLKVLLNWFRSIIQNRPRVALLFSGLKTINEIGTEWSGYFVNVQTLKVSFLHLEEAQQLIREPAPHFPSDEIFDNVVVDEIIRVTNCHPFLIQAICSDLIFYLNANKRSCAASQDVDIAVNLVLEHWDGFFHDLWDRTDKDQRQCILAILTSDKVDRHTIEQQSGLNERSVRRALQALLKRDLIILNHNFYRITMPIFAKYIEQLIDF